MAVLYVMLCAAEFDGEDVVGDGGFAYASGVTDLASPVVAV
ncbi:hypothetical protein [Mycobacteroides abscessus]|nr:hypothetical protein [Mycobacteroides abscessus]MDM2539086.1 hypothetical protein [Mycobacteroides abscessus]MDM2540886.1 hypothetical protein [Mycobacteroides abscessus]